ncbi:MAG: hypothetical protein CSA34_01845 [Desulfobulbus propionicus]|nr:MAG: hypothetical protein CSA34_01845 [Desulfobulbus propionicus]
MSTMEVSAPFLKFLGMVSVVMFIGSLLLIPILVARLPREFFLRQGRGQSTPERPRFAGAVLLTVVKNAAGLLFLGAGIVMLVLPGQGLLTILVGLSLMTFPGKNRLTARLLAMTSVRTSLNWLRKRARQAPFVFDAGER